MQREIEKGQEEAKSAELENGKLQAIIRSLEKDIVGLKHEIMERDETIQEKEKRTYDLKKKNQGTVLFTLPATRFDFLTQMLKITNACLGYDCANLEIESF